MERLNENKFSRSIWPKESFGNVLFDYPDSIQTAGNFISLQKLTSSQQNRHHCGLTTDDESALHAIDYETYSLLGPQHGCTVIEDENWSIGLTFWCDWKRCSLLYFVSPQRLSPFLSVLPPSDHQEKEWLIRLRPTGSARSIHYPLIAHSRLAVYNNQVSSPVMIPIAHALVIFLFLLREYVRMYMSEEKREKYSSMKSIIHDVFSNLRRDGDCCVNRKLGKIEVLLIKWMREMHGKGGGCGARNRNDWVFEKHTQLQEKSLTTKKSD